MSRIRAGSSYDQELVSLMGKLSFPRPTVSITDIQELRKGTSPKLDDIIGHRPIQHQSYTIPGPNCDISVSVFRSSSSSPPPWKEIPGIFYIHAGGMIAGNRFTGVDLMLDYVDQEQAVCITVEYRLAPEHPHPAPLKDCYAALEWTSDHATSLGFNSARLILAGMSAGGGLAASVALLCRDRGGPMLCAQMLISPMLDDRNITVSSFQYTEECPWTRASNTFAWNCLLNVGQEAVDISMYAAPARASDLCHLPPTYIECGSTDVFRDEDVAYASLLWENNVEAELHIWPGGWHAFQIYFPRAKLAKIAAKVRHSWLHRQLSYLEKSV